MPYINQTDFTTIVELLTEQRNILQELTEIDTRNEISELDELLIRLNSSGEEPAEADDYATAWLRHMEDTDDPEG